MVYWDALLLPLCVKNDTELYWIVCLSAAVHCCVCTRTISKQFLDCSHVLISVYVLNAINRSIFVYCFWVLLNVTLQLTSDWDVNVTKVHTEFQSLMYKGIMGGWWRWALVSPDGVTPSRMVGVSASVNLPLHHKVQKFSSGTGSPGWSRKKGRKTVVVVDV